MKTASVRDLRNHFPRVAAWIQGHNLLRSPPFPITSFGLYSSWLSSEGSRYRLEREYPLGLTHPPRSP